MLGAVTGMAGGAPLAASRLRRLAALLAVLAALFVVRGPVCVDGMLTAMPAGPMSMSLSDPRVASQSTAEVGPVSMPPGSCPMLTLTDGRSTVDPWSCLQAPAAVDLTRAAAVAAARTGGYVAAPPTAPPVVVATALRFAATLHELGLLRT